MSGFWNITEVWIKANASRDDSRIQASDSIMQR